MNKKRSKKSFIVSFLPILALLALLGLFNSPPVMADATTTVPDGLTTAEWDDIQSQIAVAQYQFASVEDSWTAPNRAQGWQTTFGISGVQVSPANDDWTWGLALTGYGYGENVVTVDNNPALTADKETITYQWNSNLNEWWINSAAGLAQGFTLQQRPGQTQGQPLQLNMTVRGDLTPVLDSDAILFQNEAGDTILRYDRLYVVDATGQEIPAHLTIDKSQLPLDDKNATYPLTIDPWLQTAKLTASDAASRDYFGYAVSLSGDRALIGANRDDDDGSDSEAAYVFTTPVTRYNLSITLAGTGSGSVTSVPEIINCDGEEGCSEDFIEGTEVTLTATAATGSTFTGWNGACGATPIEVLSIDNGTDTCVVTMDEAQSVTATFTLNTYDLTVSLNGTGEGSVTSVPEGISCEEDCSETYNYGTVVTLTPTPGIGSTFTGWNAVCDEEPAPDRLDLNTCVITIDEAKNLVILISAFGI